MFRRGTLRAVVSATVGTHGTSASVEVAKSSVGHRGILRAVGSASVVQHGASGHCRGRQQKILGTLRLGQQGILRAVGLASVKPHGASAIVEVAKSKHGIFQPVQSSIARQMSSALLGRSQ